MCPIVTVQNMSAPLYIRILNETPLFVTPHDQDLVCPN